MRDLSGGWWKCSVIRLGADYTFIETHPTVSFKSVHFTVCKLYLNQKRNKIKKKKGDAEAWRTWGQTDRQTDRQTETHTHTHTHTHSVLALLHQYHQHHQIYQVKFKILQLLLSLE